MKIMSKRALGVLGVVLCVWLALPIAAIVHDYPPINLPTEPSRSRVAVVLGAKTHGHEMSNALRARVDEAIALYQSGQVQHLIFTGGFRDKDPLREPSESSLARTYALRQGVSNQAIQIEEVSIDTYSNIEQAKLIIEREGFVEALLVSDRWHLARAQTIAQDLGLSVIPAPVMHSAFQSYRSKIDFVLREWLKIWAYRLGWRRGTE